MKTYSFYIKNFFDGPDWEEDIQAKDEWEAVNYFYDKLKKYDWSKKEIRKNIWQQK